MDRQLVKQNFFHCDGSPLSMENIKHILQKILDNYKLYKAAIVKHRALYKSVYVRVSNFKENIPYLKMQEKRFNPEEAKKAAELRKKYGFDWDDLPTDSVYVF